jgi:hypothetical protein
MQSNFENSMKQSLLRLSAVKPDIRGTTLITYIVPGSIDL